MLWRPLLTMFFYNKFVYNNIQEKCKNIYIVVYNHGYIDVDNDIIFGIKSKQATFIFDVMGASNQVIFIKNPLEHHNG